MQAALIGIIVRVPRAYGVIGAECEQVSGGLQDAYKWLKPFLRVKVLISAYLQ
jgi:hypothetical protein